MDRGTLTGESASRAWRFCRPSVWPVSVHSARLGLVGCTQPEEKKQAWNWKGYLNHAWHRVNIFVKEEGIDEPGQSHAGGGDAGKE